MIHTHKLNLYFKHGCLFTFMLRMFLLKISRYPVLTKVHVPHAMIHLCHRVDHLGHGVLIWPIGSFRFVIQLVLQILQQIPLDVCFAMNLPKEFKKSTHFQPQTSHKVRGFWSHFPGGLQDDISTTLGRVLRYPHGVAQDGFRSAHGEIQGRHGASKEPGIVAVW